MGKNLSTYSQAASILMERFPTLGLMAGTWSEKEIVEESLPPLQMEKVEALYVYGLGNGSPFFQFKKWLESGEKALIFLEDDAGLIASFLHLPEAIEILSHPKVHLELFSRKTKELEALAEKFPVRRMEVVALPSKGKVQSLRLRLLRKTTLAHALRMDRVHGYQPFQNFVQNIKQLPRSFYANRLKGAFRDIPAVVCGAGPSLQKSMEVLRGLENKALIIAGGSTLAALSSQGIMPHFGMAVDPNLEEYRRLKNSFAFEAPLLYSTRVFPAIFQTCNGPFGYMRSGIGGIPELWIEEEMDLLDPLLGDFLSPESISVTTICLAWAQFLGCNPILLNGIDMAYTGNRRYAAGVAEDEDVPLQAIDAEKSAPDRIIKRKDRNGKIIYTAVRWVMESASISHFAKKHPETQFINTTEGGIGFKGIPFQSLKSASSRFKSFNIRDLVFQQIDSSPMPKKAAETIELKMGELKESLLRVIDHLRVLAKEKRGSAALAELELKEEMAALYLFHDVYQIFKFDEFFWKKWLELALKYEVMFPRPLHTRATCCEESER